jgi:hypothetical protein
MRNCDPCSHCRSSSCSRLCGAPFDEEPLNIDVNDAGPEEVVVDDDVVDDEFLLCGGECQ